MQLFLSTHLSKFQSRYDNKQINIVNLNYRTNITFLHKFIALNLAVDMSKIYLWLQCYSQGSAIKTMTKQLNPHHI